MAAAVVHWCESASVLLKATREVAVSGNTSGSFPLRHRGVL